MINRTLKMKIAALIIVNRLMYHRVKNVKYVIQKNDIKPRVIIAQKRRFIVFTVSTNL